MLPLKNIVLRRPSTYTIWKIFSIILIGIFIGSIIVSSFFIYTHVYRTLSDVNTITILNAATRIDDVNLTGFEKAKKNIEAKIPAITVSKDLRNVFVFVSTTPSLHASSSTTAATTTP